MSNSFNASRPLANESIPLKHVLGWGGRSQGGDLTLNTLLRTWLSLKHPLSSRTFKQLECMAKSVFLMDLNVLLLIRNQEKSHLKRTMSKSRVSWKYLFYLSQFKVCGLQELAGAVFINPARYICI